MKEGHQDGGGTGVPECTRARVEEEAEWVNDGVGKWC